MLNPLIDLQDPCHTSEFKDKFVSLVNVGVLLYFSLSFHYFYWPNSNFLLLHTYFLVFTKFQKIKNGVLLGGKST